MRHNSTPPPIIMRDSPEAASLVTVTGWRSRLGHFYGDNEDLARYDGCTHTICEGCGQIREKQGWCRPCNDKRRAEQYDKLPLVEYDGGWFCHFDAEGNSDFFDGLESFWDWAADQKPEDLANIRLVLCDEQHLRQVDEEYWIDEMYEDQELPAEIQEALAVFNAAITAYGKSLSYIPGKRRMATPEIPERES